KLRSIGGEEIMGGGESVKEEMGGGMGVLLEGVVDGNSVRERGVEGVKGGWGEEIGVLIGRRLDEGGVFMEGDVGL
uniref:hypothetical protein n=1 Tax=Paenibacillus xylanexedens TaxID=528191 RepID=UPI001C930744